MLGTVKPPSMLGVCHCRGLGRIYPNMVPQWYLYPRHTVSCQVSVFPVFSVYLFSKRWIYICTESSWSVARNTCCKKNLFVCNFDMAVYAFGGWTKFQHSCKASNIHRPFIQTLKVQFWPISGSAGQTQPNARVWGQFDRGLVPLDVTSMWTPLAQRMWRCWSIYAHHDGQVSMQTESVTRANCRARVHSYTRYALYRRLIHMHARDRRSSL